MSPDLAVALSVAVMVLLLGLGMPIAFCLVISGFGGYLLMEGLERTLALLSFTPWQTLAQYGFTVIPMFVLMGMLAGESGLGEDTFLIIRRWMGRVPGGLAISTCYGCAAFGTLSGDAISTSVTIGRVAIPEMKKSGYDLPLALASVASAAPIAAMIPPSVLICLYGMITGQSVGKLLVAGYLPGILNALIFGGMIYLRVLINPRLAPPAPGSTWKEKIDSLKRGWVVLACALMIAGGIYTGVFTPTEAGGMGALIIFVVGVIRKKLNRSGIKNAILGSIKVVGMFTAILIGAFMFSYMVVISGTIPKIVAFIASLNFSAMGVIIAIMALYLVLGCFMQAVAMLFITMPFLYPLMNAYHIDPIWAGILIVHMCEVGCITPPFGITLFATKSLVPEEPTTTIIRGIFWFLMADVVTLAILIAFPQIALFLPSRMK